MNMLRKLPELLWVSAFGSIMIAAFSHNTDVAMVCVIGAIILGGLAISLLKKRADEE